MFLKSVHIENYNQFENLELDLTYPEGHAKAGEPLEKICIIGDNGTGKTTILELIRDYYNYVWENPEEWKLPDLEKYANSSISFNNLDKPERFDFWRDSAGAKIIYFPTGIDVEELFSKVGNYESNSSEEEQYINRVNKERELDHKLDLTESLFVYNLKNTQVLIIWERLKSKISPSIEEELSYRRSLLKGLNEQNEAELDDIYNKFKAYKKKNPNGYDDLAEFLNPLLNKFHLKLNTKINLDKFDEIEFLSLIDKDGNIIPIEKWSTGIRQLIYTVLPLYALKPKTGIIMIDEAENSLYPSTQRSIIDFYKSVCPDMQLIIATHSPILASSFEPWEVIELKFNEKGKVERKPYFKGENHVDNYHIRPMYLQWDSLFMKMFGLENDSNEVRNDMLMELAILKRDLKNSNGKDKKELQEKYEKLAEQLDWATL